MKFFPMFKIDYFYAASEKAFFKFSYATDISLFASITDSTISFELSCGIILRSANSLRIFVVVRSKHNTSTGIFAISFWYF